ncbi:hypothetical protein M9H77_18607 [Catharanthus roseus]|uniref:Uncharacterized protein n=1 Tax=Catharanthus roseus TaxID=4058 RepID=A0ACC0B7Z0_CATRO|nr:hypothetical protein M9H77_18607 [Catharanthus roseus]
MSTEGHLPTQSHQEGIRDPLMMNLNETLRSMQQCIERLVRDIEDLKKHMCHLATKIENQRKRIGFSKTNLPSSRIVVSKPQVSTYKGWPKKEDTPKVAFNDNPNPKVEKKREG